MVAGRHEPTDAPDRLPTATEMGEAIAAAAPAILHVVALATVFHAHARSPDQAERAFWHSRAMGFTPGTVVSS